MDLASLRGPCDVQDPRLNCSHSPSIVAGQAAKYLNSTGPEIACLENLTTYASHFSCLLAAATFQFLHNL